MSRLGAPSDTVAVVLLELGSQRFDVTTRALLMAVIPADQVEDKITAVVSDRPAILELIDSASVPAAACMRSIRQRFEGPVVVRSSAATSVHDWFRAGVAAVHDERGLADPLLLDIISEANASVVVGAPADNPDPVSYLAERVAWAEAVGIPRSHIVVHAALADVESLSRRRWPVMVDAGSGPDAQGAHVKAITHGARIVARHVEAEDLRATRRTIDTVAGLLARRDTTAENDVHPIGSR